MALIAKPDDTDTERELPALRLISQSDTIQLGQLKVTKLIRSPTVIGSTT